MVKEAASCNKAFPAARRCRWRLTCPRTSGEQSHGPSLLQGHVFSGIKAQVSTQSVSDDPDPAENVDARHVADVDV